MLRLVAIVFLLALGSAHAEPNTPDSYGPLQEGSQHEAQGNQGEQDDQSGPQGNHQEPPAFWHFFLRDGQKVIARYCAQPPQDEEDKWLREFRCETPPIDLGPTG